LRTVYGGEKKAVTIDCKRSRPVRRLYPVGCDADPLKSPIVRLAIGAIPSYEASGSEQVFENGYSKMRYVHQVEPQAKKGETELKRTDVDRPWVPLR
jgi:hypothetical protein